MNRHLASIYGYLPPTARDFAATAYGYKLVRQRYGPETAPLQTDAAERESWRPDQWASWKEDQLARLLHRAATLVPYYRTHWQTRRRRGDRASWERIENWPLLTKAEVQEHPLAFVAEDQDPRKMIRESTSGTSGTPLVLLRSHRTARAWYALTELRTLGWHGLSRNNRLALFGGQVVTPLDQRRPPFWVWNSAMQQLYCSSFHLSPGFVPRYLEAIQQHQVEYISGYPSSLVQLAQGAIETACPVPRLRMVITHSEPLYPYQQRLLEQVFGCPVHQYYGLSELVAAASTCKHGSLHTWPEVGLIEIVPDGAGRTRDGELVATSLLDQDMPLIRYRTLDRGRLAPAQARCECGRTLPVFEMLEGREEDLLWTLAGERVYMMPWPESTPIRESKVIQETRDRVVIEYVPRPGRPGAKKGIAPILAGHIRQLLGPVHVDLVEREQIPRERSGKFRWVECRVDSAAHPRALRHAVGR